MSPTERTSLFMGTIIIGDDLRPIEVDASGGGPEQVLIMFTLPDFTGLPRIYITADKARELRDALTTALTELDPADLHIVPAAVQS